MSTWLKISICALGATILIACSKGGNLIVDDEGNGGHVNNPNDTTVPVLTIHTPSPDQVFPNTSTISITGNIADNLGLYRGIVKLTNDANGVVVKEQPYEIHGVASYNFNVNYTASVTAVTNYTVTVWFEDHGYNAVTKTVKIKVNP